VPPLNSNSHLSKLFHPVGARCAEKSRRTSSHAIFTRNHTFFKASPSRLSCLSLSSKDRSDDSTGCGSAFGGSACRLGYCGTVSTPAPESLPSKQKLIEQHSTMKGYLWLHGKQGSDEPYLLILLVLQYVEHRRKLKKHSTTSACNRQDTICPCRPPIRQQVPWR
jgi:hypothetical protein